MCYVCYILFVLSHYCLCYSRGFLTKILALDILFLTAVRAAAAAAAAAAVVVVVVVVVV